MTTISMSKTLVKSNELMAELLKNVKRSNKIIMSVNVVNILTLIVILYILYGRT